MSGGNEFQSRGQSGWLSSSPFCYWEFYRRDSEEDLSRFSDEEFTEVGGVVNGLGEKTLFCTDVVCDGSSWSCCRTGM